MIDLGPRPARSSPRQRPVFSLGARRGGDAVPTAAPFSRAASPSAASAAAAAFPSPRTAVAKEDVVTVVAGAVLRGHVAKARPSATTTARHVTGGVGGCRPPRLDRSVPSTPRRRRPRAVATTPPPPSLRKHVAAATHPRRRNGVAGRRALSSSRRRRRPRRLGPDDLDDGICRGMNCYRERSPQRDASLGRRPIRPSSKAFGAGRANSNACRLPSSPSLPLGLASLVFYADERFSRLRRRFVALTFSMGPTRTVPKVLSPRFFAALGRNTRATSLLSAPRPA